MANRKWTDGMLSTEDWWAVWLGLIMFGAALLSIWQIDAVGWMAKTKTWEWTNLTGDFSWKKLLKTSGKEYKGMHPFVSLLVTWGIFTALTCIGAYFQKLDVKKFFLGFTCIFFITWGAWMIGHEAHFKALKTGQSITQSEIYGKNVYCTTKVHKCTKQINKALNKMGINVKGGDTPTQEQAAAAVDKSKNAIRMSWGLQLGGGFSYMLALAIGLIIGNFMRGFARFLSEAAKPEWFIKTAIVYLGIKLGKMSIDSTKYGKGLLFDMAIAGAAATFVAYLMFWPIVYALGRKVFKLRRDASAVLSSGISICGICFFSSSVRFAGSLGSLYPLKSGWSLVSTDPLLSELVPSPKPA